MVSRCTGIIPLYFKFWCWSLALTPVFLLSKLNIILSGYRRTSNYWIALGEKMSVYRGIRGSRRSACGPSENLKDWLSSCRWYLASLMICVLMLSTNCEIKNQIVVIQYYRNSIITGPTVVNNIGIITMMHRYTGAAQRTARTGVWRRVRAAHHTKPVAQRLAFLERYRMSS